jgi:hypothetical protein
MHHEYYFRQMTAQHEAMFAPYKWTIEQYEATVAPLKRLMEPYESIVWQMEATMKFLAGPALDYEKMFGTDSITKNIEAMRAALGSMVDVPVGFNMYEGLREAAEKRQREEAERAREAMALQDRLMRDVTESNERALDRLAEKVVENLTPTFAVKKKPRIGFGQPEAK